MEGGEPASVFEEYLRLEEDIQCRQFIGTDDDDIVKTVITKRGRQEESQKSGAEDEPDPIPPPSQLLASLRQTQRLLLRESRSELY